MIVNATFTVEILIFGSHFILNRIKLNEEDVQLSCTLNVQVRQLEEFRRIRLDQLAILIQTAFRAWWARYTYTRKRLAQIRIATVWRRYKVSTIPPICT